MNLILVTVLAISASPIPKTIPAELRKTLETAWNQFGRRGTEHNKRMAYYTMVRHPQETVSLLCEKIKPLNLERATAIQLLNDLGSEDEKVWKPAYDQLCIYDIRLAMDLAKAVEASPSTLATQRLAATLYEYKSDHFISTGFSCEISNDTRYAFNDNNPNGSISTHFTNRFVKGLEKPSWSQIQYVTYVLRQIGTPDALKLLKLIATGDPDSEPVSAAREILRKRSLPASNRLTLPERFDRIDWKIDRDRFEQLGNFYDFLDNPKETVAFLQKKLKPLMLSTARAAQLLNDLDHEQDKIYRAAFDELCLFPIQLVNEDLGEWLPKRATTLAMSRLAGTLLNPPQIDYFGAGVFQFRVDKQQINFETKKGNQSQCAIINLDPNRPIWIVAWHRIEVAIDLLEIFETPESIALLKLMATGHPRASPTIAAKEALGRLKVKP